MFKNRKVKDIFDLTEQKTTNIIILHNVYKVHRNINSDILNEMFAFVIFQA